MQKASAEDAIAGNSESRLVNQVVNGLTTCDSLMNQSRFSLSHSDSNSRHALPMSPPLRKLPDSAAAIISRNSLIE